LQGALIAHPVINAIGVLARHQHAFFPQDGQMLGDIALRSTDCLDDVLDTCLVFAKHAQDFQAQRVGDGFQRTGGQLDVLLLVDQTEGWRFQDKTSFR